MCFDVRGDLCWEEERQGETMAVRVTMGKYCRKGKRT